MRWNFLGAILRTGRGPLVPRTPHKTAGARSFPFFFSSTLTSPGRLWRLVLLGARARGTVRAGFRGGARPRKFGSGGSNGRPSTFRLSAGVTTLHLKTTVGVIVLALAHPIDGPQPDGYTSRDSAALQESGRAKDAGPMRRALFERTQRWLEYYFAGEVEDTGESLGDIIREFGVYLPAADSRILRVFPPDKSKSDRSGEDGRDEDDNADGDEIGPIPVVQVTIHFRYRHPPVMTGDSDSAAAFNTAEGIKDNILTTTFKHIRRWDDPRFDRCIVWLVTPDTEDFYYLDWPDHSFEQIPFWDAGVHREETSNAITLV